MANATSSAVTRRPMGWRARRAAAAASASDAWSSSRRTHGVSAVPGVTALTRMPWVTKSAAIARVNDRTAPLLAEYSARWGTPTSATTEQMFTIAALLDRRRYGSAARVTRAMPTTLTLNTR